MPFYEYECKDCGGSFELMQSIKADPAESCELCPGTNIRRKIFPAGMIFKGSGFYSTEYRSSNYVQQQNSEKTTGTDSQESGSSNKEGSSVSEKSEPACSSTPESASTKSESSS